MFWVKFFHILAWFWLCCCSGQEPGSWSHFWRSNQKLSQPWSDAAELHPAPAPDPTQILPVGPCSPRRVFHRHWEDKYPFILFSIRYKLRWWSRRHASCDMCAMSSHHMGASSLVFWGMRWTQSGQMVFLVLLLVVSSVQNLLFKMVQKKKNQTLNMWVPLQ